VTLQHVQGSYSLLLLAETSSSDCAIHTASAAGFGELGAPTYWPQRLCLDLIEATYIRRSNPAKMVVINGSVSLNGMPHTHVRSRIGFGSRKPACWCRQTRQAWLRSCLRSGFG